MNDLSTLGLILLVALLAGHAVKHLRIPEVTGYILSGILLGPSGLGWVSHENLSTLGIFSEVALGFILFSIGSVFSLDRVVHSGRAVLRVTTTEAVSAFILVTAGMLLLGQNWQVAVLLGAISMETAAASTLMVVRECDSAGPLTDTLTGLIGVNNLICLIGFTVVAGILDLAIKFGSDLTIWRAVYESVFPLFWQTIGSVALGYLVGLLLARWSSHVKEHGEMLILLTGSLLLCVGVSSALELSSLVASLAVGATMVNLAPRSESVFGTLSRTDPPFYAIFFVIAGADLNLGLLKTLGVVGLAYVLCRMAGKFIGSRLGARKAGLPEHVRRYLGIAILSQAGLAVGLTYTISKRFPEVSPAVTSVVLASIVVFEMIGPLGARFSIVKSNEIRERATAPLTL
jgi:Kef-type K+ transport system membrane component KefB